MTRGTGKQAAIEGQVAAGKTGTTQSFRDAWFVGYTAHYVGGVWIGNDDGTRMKKVTGGTLPAKLWHEIMLYAHRDKTPLPLPGTRAPSISIAIARLPWQRAGSARRRPAAVPPRVRHSCRTVDRARSYSMLRFGE